MSRTARPEAIRKIQRAVGQRIAEARKLVEPNSAAFCRLLGCDPSTLHKIENGERAPSIFVILDIAHKLRLTTDYLLTGNLVGVESEIAARLFQLEMQRRLSGQPGSHMGSAPDTSPQPRRQARRKKAA